MYYIYNCAKCIRYIGTSLNGGRQNISMGRY